MATRVKKAPIIFVLAIAVGAFGLQYAYTHGFLSSPDTKSSVPTVAALPEVKDTPVPNVAVPAVPLPDTAAAESPGVPVRVNVMAWNGQFGLMFANGGPASTRGSLMAEHKVGLQIIREDDCNKMSANLLSFAKALKDGEPHPKTGSNFVIVMGDGSAAFLAGLNPELARLGSEYAAEIVGVIGRSNGEDKFMGPPEVKKNPKAAKGMLVAGVIRDGDWNIALKWAADNNIPNNPNEKTYDPAAINWLGVDDFISAGTKYITGESACEDRPIVSTNEKGETKRTGETKHVCVNGVVTWTPGDVNVAMKRGGLVTIASTKEYSSQMPTTIIGIKKWDAANSSTVSNMLEAALLGGEQVKAYPAALHRAAEASAAVYKEESADYWEKYYKGVVETDKTGVSISLGGSMAFGIADAARFYGLAGGASLMEATYTTFGDVVKAQYPKLVPKYPAPAEVINTSYLKAVTSRVKAATPAAVPTFKAEAPIADVVSKGSWSITFDTGKATITPEGQTTLTKLAKNLMVGEDLALEIDGHTDNTGNPEANMTLSKNRAEAVKTFLHNYSPGSFPNERFSIKAFGQTKPTASNDTPDGQRKNRRVDIVQGMQ